MTIYGSFTSSSSYKPILYLSLARLPYSFRTVNLKTGMQKTPEYLAINRWGVVRSLRHRGLTILQSDVILDYLARTTGHFEGTTDQQRWQAREWLSWEVDHITAVARVRHSARTGRPGRVSILQCQIEFSVANTTHQRDIVCVLPPARGVIEELIASIDPAQGGSPFDFLELRHDLIQCLSKRYCNAEDRK